MTGIRIKRSWSSVKVPKLQSIFGTLILLFFCCAVLIGCQKEKSEEAQHQGPLEVSVMEIKTGDVPLILEFVGATESSHQVEIRSRVEGFLEKKSYEEGGFVKAGQVMFQIDRRPFEANLQQVRGELAQQEARLATARANLKRIRPLAEKNAVSKKDLDDAVGQEQAGHAAVLSARGKVRDAELKLGYTTIRSPISGFAGRANKQEGSYIAVGTEGLLSYVAKLDPIWVNFSISENENLKLRESVAKGIIRRPPNGNFTVEINLADGSIFPNKGILNFADPSYKQETGTFQVRAQIVNMKNPLEALRPGQFVRVHLGGATYLNAILVPRRAVMQGAKGHFAWIADRENKVELRNVVIGDWHGDEVFISSGLKAGDRLILDNLIKLSPGMPVKVTMAPAPSMPANAAQPDRGQKPLAVPAGTSQGQTKAAAPVGTSQGLTNQAAPVKP